MKCKGTLLLLALLSSYSSQALSEEWLVIDAPIEVRDEVPKIFIQRLWRSPKYEQVYLAQYTTGSEARAGIAWWMDFYNQRRPHSSLKDQTPDEAYTREAALRPGLRPASLQPRAA